MDKINKNIVASTIQIIFAKPSKIMQIMKNHLIHIFTGRIIFLKTGSFSILVRKSRFC